MVSFDSNRNKISVFGKLISIQRAKQLSSQLNSAVKKAEEYNQNPQLQEVNLNEMALSHLLSPSDEEYPLRIELSYSNEGEIADELFTDILKHNEKYGLIDAHIKSTDINSFFEQSTGLVGMELKIPDSLHS